MSRERTIDLAWKIGPVVVALAAAWATMQTSVANLQRDKLDATRFIADSINTVRTLDDIQMGVREANGRLREIQCGLPAKPGCR